MEEDVDNINLFLLDDSHNLIEEKNIPKPKTYNELKLIINNIFIRPLNNYQIFYYNIYNLQKIITNDEEYKQSKDILFINELKEKEKPKESMYESNYDKLSESKQDILDERYNCNICQEIFKEEEQPLLCYRCQKLFHKKCLEDWNNKCIEKNIEFSCPKCKYELPLKDWNKKLNYNDERLNEVNLMKEITNKNQLNTELKSEYSIFKLNTYDTFKNILDKVDKINSLFEKNKPDSNNIISSNEFNQYEIPFKIVEKLNNIEESIKNIEKKYQKDIPIEKLLCKIPFEKKISGEIIKDKAIGFFCETDNNFSIKYFLFTNYHILSENDVKIGKIIEIEYLGEFGYMTKKIEITKKRRIFFDTKLNYTCIEIFESDNIKYFFKIESEIYENNINLLNKDVLMFDNNFSSKSGKLISIEDNIIKHNISINNHYAGSPLIIKTDNVNYIIGLFYGEDIYDLANKFSYILENIKNQIKITSNIIVDNKNEINCMYYSQDNNFIRLIHHYNGLFSDEEIFKETRELHFQARMTNEDFFNKNIELFINGEKVDFTYEYSMKKTDQKIITATFKFKKLLHNASFMFSGCRDLISVDLSSFNTSKVTNMCYMFRECQNLKKINFSSFNTSKVVNMQGMFYFCRSLKSLDLSSFKTNKVTDMSEMFFSCQSLESINLSSFRVKNVINMSSMFRSCGELTSLDLSNFNTCSALNMSYMFSNCANLRELDISLFDTEGANIYKIFKFCLSLKKENIKNKNKNDKLSRIRKIGLYN